MLIDITLKITPKMSTNAQGNNQKAYVGHLGTHFDVMNKEFPLSYIKRDAIVFDVSEIENRDIEEFDIDLSCVSEGMFIAFYTGFIEKHQYGSKEYFSNHPQLSNELIEKLSKKGVSIIGIDFAGMRRGKEHSKKDQYCADHGVFVIENLCNLKEVLNVSNRFKAYTFPMNYAEMTGLPCRVVAEIKE